MKFIISVLQKNVIKKLSVFPISFSKKIFFISLLFIANFSIAQVRNIKSGNWSDNTVWSTGNTPSANDDVILDFDIVVDVSAGCLSFNSNGHNVLIRPGIHFDITGTSGDTLLAKYIQIEYNEPEGYNDTVYISFTYDSLKRNIGIESRNFINFNGYTYHTTFYYEGDKRVPFKRTGYANDENGVLWYADTSLFTFDNLKLLQDSLNYTAVYATGQTVKTFSYEPGTVIRRIKEIDSRYTDIYYALDTAWVTYQNENIVEQIGMGTWGMDVNGIHIKDDHYYTYDDHPNPLYNTQNKLLLFGVYPVYNVETSNDQSFGKNNFLTINEPNYVNRVQTYEHNAKGYPIKMNCVTYYNLSDPGITIGHYIYTH